MFIECRRDHAAFDVRLLLNTRGMFFVNAWGDLCQINFWAEGYLLNVAESFDSLAARIQATMSVLPDITTLYVCGPVDGRMCVPLSAVQRIEPRFLAHTHEEAGSMLFLHGASQPVFVDDMFAPLVGNLATGPVSRLPARSRKDEK